MKKHFLIVIVFLFSIQLSSLSKAETPIIESYPKCSKKLVVSVNEFKSNYRKEHSWWNSDLAGTSRGILLDELSNSNCFKVLMDKPESLKTESQKVTPFVVTCTLENSSLNDSNYSNLNSDLAKEPLQVSSATATISCNLSSSNKILASSSSTKNTSRINFNPENNPGYFKNINLVKLMGKAIHSTLVNLIKEILLKKIK